MTSLVLTDASPLSSTQPTVGFSSRIQPPGAGSSSSFPTGKEKSVTSFRAASTRLLHWSDLAGEGAVAYDRFTIKARSYARSKGQRRKAMQEQRAKKKLVYLQNRRDNAFGNFEFSHNKRVKDKYAAKCTRKGATVRNLKKCPFEYMMALVKKAKGYVKQAGLEPSFSRVDERFIAFSVPLVLVGKTEPLQPHGILRNPLHPLPEFGSGYKTDSKGRKVRFSRRLANKA